MAGRTRFFDLSVTTRPNESEPFVTNIRHESHADTAPMMAEYFGCTLDDLPDRLGWANEHVELVGHAGTHIDAPWHYFPTCGGKPARTMDECPLEWFYGDGVVLDFRHKERGALIDVNDLEAALDRIGYTLKPLDIVMLQTDTDKLWGRKEYFDAGSGLGRESTLWLCDRGIKVIGTDAWTLDRPFWAMKQAFRETGDPSLIWAAHRVGIEREYCQIEKLANLDQLPRPHGFKVACFPIKLEGGSAGWTRVVAMVDEGLDGS
jgi:kynurenine formamidase